MKTFVKYILVNLLIFVPIIILVYWFTKPFGDGNSVSASMKQHFINDTAEAHQRYNQFKKSVETNDLSQREQAKVNLEQQLSGIKTTFNSPSVFAEIATIIEQNYRQLISLHLASSGSKSDIGKQKETLTKQIQDLEGQNRNDELKLSLLKSQPSPQPTP